MFGVPELSRFFGIIIRMYMEVGAPHNLPHFHAGRNFIRPNTLPIGTDCKRDKHRCPLIRLNRNRS